MKAKKTGTIYPAEPSDNRPMFEYLLIVLLSDRCELQKIYRISWEQFVELRSWDKRMNAWYLTKSQRVFSAAEDISGKRP